MPTRIKKISGNKYLYYTYYDNGKKKDMYCGLASENEAKRKALEFELEWLKRQKKELVDKIIQTESKLNKITKLVTSKHEDN